jgi:PAN domain
MWETVGQVTTGVGLAAFIAAIALSAFRLALKHRISVIKSIPAAYRADTLSRELNSFGINASNLLPEQQYQIALKEIGLRAKRLTTFAVIVIFIATISGAVATYAIFAVPALRSEASTHTPPTPQITEPTVSTLIDTDLDRAEPSYTTWSSLTLTRCQQLCLQDKKCKAYTFVPPDYKNIRPLWDGPVAACFPKEHSTTLLPRKGVISGIKTEYNTTSTILTAGVSNPLSSAVPQTAHSSATARLNSWLFEGGSAGQSQHPNAMRLDALQRWMATSASFSEVPVSVLVNGDSPDFERGRQKAIKDLAIP